MSVYKLAAASILGLSLAHPGLAGETAEEVEVKDERYSPYLGQDFPQQVWWEDPAFDPGQPAFYYVRVLEIPTPTWTTYDAAVYGTDLPDNMPATHQERAYTSPIWYTPATP